jgi:hypothetical protein
MIMFSNTLKPEPIRYWMVTLTLTSSEEINFYVKTKTQFDALKIADEYQDIANEPKLLAKMRNKLLLKW